MATKLSGFKVDKMIFDDLKPYDSKSPIRPSKITKPRLPTPVDGMPGDGSHSSFGPIPPDFFTLKAIEEATFEKEFMTAAHGKSSPNGVDGFVTKVDFREEGTWDYRHMHTLHDPGHSHSLPSYALRRVKAILTVEVPMDSDGGSEVHRLIERVMQGNTSANGHVKISLAYAEGGPMTLAEPKPEKPSRPEVETKSEEVGSW